MYILVPCIYKQQHEEGQEQFILRGFKAAPVFCVEDTHGQPLDYEQIDPPSFPLIDVAEQWGISVKAIPKGWILLESR